jgi:hypothetical protein
MKQTRYKSQPTPESASWQGNTGRQKSGRHDMNRFLRGLMIFLLAVLIAAICLAGYAALYPVVLTFDQNVLNYNQHVQIDYQVLTRPNEFSGESAQGMDGIYLRDYVQAVDSTFTYQFTADRAVNAAYRQGLKAEVLVCDKADPAKVLLRKPISLKPDQTGQTIDGIVRIQETATLVLDDYAKIADTFKVPQDVEVSFFLAVYMDIQIEAALPADKLNLYAQPTMLIPLSQSQFAISRQGTGDLAQPVRQSVRYQLMLTPLPIVVYPVVAAFCLVLLVIILATTRGHRKNKFDHQLHHMMRQARSRLLLIRDKAWEPEWCITVADFRTLVRTARKLKHPLFCYVDRLSVPATAYFYVYYGENNFCYTFTPDQGNQPSTGAGTPIEANFSGLPKSGKSPVATSKPELVKPAAAEASIPLLPETDRSSEVLF